jgi:hypothetical protein
MIPNKENKLGDVTAEDDSRMLSRAFYQTSDYDALTEGNNKTIIIGRRGAGKTALCLRLEQYWKQKTRHHSFSQSAEKDQIYGVRSELARFSGDYDQTRTAVEICWMYLLLLGCARSLSTHPRFASAPTANWLRNKIKSLYDPNRDVGYNLSSIMREGFGDEVSPDKIIAKLADKLELGQLKSALVDVFQETRVPVSVLIDKLDEGYQPDKIGIGLVSGIIHGTIQLNRKYPDLMPIVFVRDNMFRAVAEQDDNFTRDIEGGALKLHWGEKELLGLVAARLRVAFDFKDDNDLRTWNDFVLGDLRGEKGFRHVLNLTLYRPRDLIALLNKAFSNAVRENRTKIHFSDIEASAGSFSFTRLEDLIKEYRDIYPSLFLFTDAFKGKNASFKKLELEKILIEILATDISDPEIATDLSIIKDCSTAIHNLYSIGFLGIRDPGRPYQFCHDGSSQDFKTSNSTEFLVHPSYWRALSISSETISEEVVQEIHDEFDIERGAVSIDYRNVRISNLLKQYTKIPSGKDGANEFEKWCFDVIQIVFSGVLKNIELKPNKNATQRRDIVARNTGNSEFWGNLKSRFEVDQVLFEIKNYDNLEGDDYRQVNSYLKGAYGHSGFIISRSEQLEPNKDRDLKWIREFYLDSDKRLIIRISSKHFYRFLEKLKKPENYHYVDEQLCKLVDNYLRRWLVIN